MDPSSRKVTPKKQRPNTAVKKRKRPRQSRISIDVDNIDPEILQNPGGSMEPQESRVNNSSIISDPELYRNIGGSVEAAELVPNFSALDTEAELFRKIDASILEDKKSHNAITPKIGGKARSVDFTTPTNRRPTTAGNKRTKTQAFRFSSEIRSNNRENATDNEEKGVKVIPRKRFKLRENSQQMPTLLASVQRTPTSSSQTSSVSRGRFRSVDNHHQMPILCQIRTPKSTYTPSHGASVRSSYRPSHHTSAQQSQDHKTPEIRPKDPKLGKLIKSYNMSYFAMMGEYWRNGLDEGTKVFIHKGHDEYIRRALVARGWYENKEKNSIAYHLKWFSTDLGFDYEKIHPDQTYNHILGNRALTTKTGLNTCFRSVTTYGSHIDEFYPRCYDLSDKQQRKEFVQDYESTAVQSIVTNHAYYFSDTTTDSIEVNVLCLRHAILYCKSLIATNICENQSRHEFMQRNEAPGDWKYTWKSLIKYSKIVPPFDEDTFDKLDTCHQYEVEDVWMIPDQGLISD